MFHFVFCLVSETDAVCNHVCTARTPWGQNLFDRGMPHAAWDPVRFGYGRTKCCLHWTFESSFHTFPILDICTVIRLEMFWLFTLSSPHQVTLEAMGVFLVHSPDQRWSTHLDATRCHPRDAKVLFFILAALTAGSAVPSGLLMPQMVLWLIPNFLNLEDSPRVAHPIYPIYPLIPLERV